LVVLAWVTNLVLLGTALFWVSCDGRCPQTVEGLWDTVIHAKPTAIADFAAKANFVLWGLGGVAVSTLGVLLGLVLGPKRCRGMRAWLLAMGLVSFWCGLGSAWSMLYWEGQQFRVTRHLPQIQSLASSLRAEWPQQDGETPELGCFLAYPKHNPSTLMLLGSVDALDSTVGVAAIERTPDGAIVFELTGPEAGAWLEWRSDGSAPKSFVGGMQTCYQLKRLAPLGSQWWLVRYNLSPATGLTMMAR